MRRKFIFYPVIICFGVMLVYALKNFYDHKDASPETTGYVEEDNREWQDDMQKAMELEFLKTLDPALHKVPYERLALAKEYVESQQQLYQNRTDALSWSERGPNNIGGRVRSVIVDMNDATGNTIFAGSVSGGIWKCTSFKTGAYAWTKVNDNMDNLAVTALAQDPSTPNTLYAGTGEGYFNFDAVRGGGIFKSTNGGATWTALASTIPTASNDFSYVQDIVVTASGVVYAAATSAIFCNAGGVFKSTNGGTSWTRVIGSFGGGNCGNANDFKGSDLEIAANGDLYATTGYSSSGANDYGKIWKSAATLGANQGNSGQWTNITPTPPGADPGFSRVELACAPSNSSYLYALCQSYNTTAIRRLYSSTNGGTGWTEITPPTWCDQGVNKADFTRGQCWYDLIAAFDPTTVNNVYIGGVDVMKSTNGGSTFSQFTQWAAGCAALPNVHADIHDIEFINGSANDIIIANDGGIYYSSNGGTSFTAKNSGFNVTQYYAADIHPTSANQFIGGAQDNGSHIFNTAGIGSGTPVSGGDGAFCHIDQVNPLVQMSAYTNAFIRVTRNGWSSAVYDNGAATGRFINPSDYDDGAGILYVADNANVLGRFINIKSGSIAYEQKALALGGNQISAVKADPNTANRVWLGCSDGTPTIVRVDNANAAAPIATNFNIGAAGAGWYVSNIDVEKGNANHLLVTFSNYGVTSVYESTNGGTTWTAIEGNLPDMPIRWGIFLPSGSSEGVIAVATELGIFTTTVTNGASTNWVSNSSGFPKVRTDMLQFRPFDNTILAATHGRGLFTTTLAVSPITWTGAVSNDWGNASNWNPARTPTATDVVIIPNGAANMPVSVTGTKVCFSLTTATAASVTISGTLQMAGSLQNDGVITGTGMLEMNGTFNQSIKGDGDIAYLKINNANGASVTSGVGNVQTITDVLDVTLGTFITGDNIVLKSSNTKTARVAQVTGSISGNVIVERYIGIPASKRAWRLLTAPLWSTNVNQFVYDHWQEAGANNAGYGTHVTGPAANPAVNGLDAISQSSMKKYNGSSLVEITNTKTEVLFSNAASAANKPFFIFVRGDRTASNLTPPNKNNTVLRATGAIQTGNQNFSVAGSVANAFNSFGNPYPSPVDFNTVWTGSTNINRRFYAWDPNLSTVGAYVTIDYSGGVYVSSNGASAQNQHIQSGQAVFMQTTSNGNIAVLFTEASKSTNSINNLFRGNDATGMFRMYLHQVNSDNTTTVADGALAVYNNNYSVVVNSDDAPKLDNINENLALARDNQLLSIEKRPDITGDDTLYIKLWNTTQRNYKFSFEGSGFDPLLQAVLVDKYLNTSTPLSVSGTTDYSFNVNADAASQNANRFIIAFRQAAPLPVFSINIRGYEKENGIQVDWNVQDETGVAHYEVEKNTNGRSFSKVSIAEAKDKASYSWFDANAVTGANYYRIKIVAKDGKESYSRVISVVKGKGEIKFTIYPNPVKTGEAIALYMQNMEKGNYTMNVHDMNGRLVYTRTFQYNGGGSGRSIDVGVLQPGVYNVEMINEDKDRFMKKLVVK